MRQLFDKELCNTGRQFEFDLAKAVCIFGMVFVHCFEQLSIPATESSEAYYIITIVIDALFGAATFMAAMGLGIAYSLKDGKSGGAILMKRGIKIFIFAYILGFLRYGLPELLCKYYGDSYINYILDSMDGDIMQFAGLALLLFGLLKWLNLSDKSIMFVAIGMSVFGSFVRMFDVSNPVASDLIGLFLGSKCPTNVIGVGIFPLATWFIFVIGGYIYGKALRHCKDMHKYYSITLPVSAIILVIYMIIAIPNQLGMMNESIIYYYQMTTIDAVFCFIGMIFATSAYHFISLLLGDKVKKVIQSISSNINRIYCIHWVIIGCLDIYLACNYEPTGFSSPVLFLIGILIFIVANLLAALYTKFIKKRTVYE